MTSQNFKASDGVFSSYGSNCSSGSSGSYEIGSGCQDKPLEAKSTDDHNDSEVTKAIKYSIERSIANNSSIDSNNINFKELVDLTKSMISQIPVVVNNTGKVISKIVEVGKSGVSTINSFATSLNYDSKNDVVENNK